MLKIIIVAHGHFSDGIMSALELIAGKQEDLIALNFIEGMSSQELETAIDSELVAKQEYLILTDLLGGTPFNLATGLMVSHPDKVIRVLSGLNLAMLIEAVFSRNSVSDIDQLVDSLISSSQKAIVDAKVCVAVQEDELPFEGGI